MKLIKLLHASPTKVKINFSTQKALFNQQNIYMYIYKSQDP